MSRSRSTSPLAKRIKLESGSPIIIDSNEEPGDERVVNHDMDDSENGCSICLQAVVDRTVIPKCSHEFCFECLLVWTEQSRRCPLCSQTIGEYLIHSIRSRYDYRKHFLSPLRTSPLPPRPAQNSAILQNTRHQARRRRRERVWGTRDRDGEHEESDKLERSIVKRRWLYEHDLYAKHVASNAFTKYRPYPLPAQFAGSQELISRTTTFLRRELQVWEGLDVEFLTTLIISLMKAIDIRSESAVKLISEFLDMDEPYTPGGKHRNAEHFAHEVYSYVRSPFKDLFVYDSVVQYEAPENVDPPPNLEQSRRWHPPSSSRVNREGSRSPQRARRRSRSSERSTSWSPSGRRFSPPPRNVDDFIPPPRSRNREDAESQLASTSRTALRTSAASMDEPVPSTQRKDKGKRRADTPTSPEESSFNAINTIDLAKTPPAVRAPLPEESRDPPKQQAGTSGATVRVNKPPRHRTLLDSVKAHLSGNSSSTAPAIATSIPEHHQPRSSKSKPTPTVSIDSIDSPSSLLVRLSDPSNSSAVPTPTVSSQVSSGLSTPSSAIANLTLTQTDPTVAAKGKDHSLETRQPNPPNASLVSMEGRAKLLARLNREKKQAQVSTTTSENQHADLRPLEDASPAVEPQDEAASREAKLRTQAQLRVRLAAEKRLMVGEDRDVTSS